jgi:hypothetical protein
MEYLLKQFKRIEQRIIMSLNLGLGFRGRGLGADAPCAHDSVMTAGGGAGGPRWFKLSVSFRLGPGTSHTPPELYLQVCQHLIRRISMTPGVLEHTHMQTTGL